MLEPKKLSADCTFETEDLSLQSSYVQQDSRTIVRKARNGHQQSSSAIFEFTKLGLVRWLVTGKEHVWKFFDRRRITTNNWISI